MTEKVFRPPEDAGPDHAWQPDPRGRLPVRALALLRVYIDAWQERWPGAGSDGLGPDHRGWIAHRAFWGPSTRAVMRYRHHFVQGLGPRRPQDRTRVAEWLRADLRRPKGFFAELRAELIARLTPAEDPRALLACRPWRAGIAVGPGNAQHRSRGTTAAMADNLDLPDRAVSANKSNGRSRFEP